jgi:hypothetical protein
MPVLSIVMPNMGVPVCQIEGFSMAGQFLLCFSTVIKDFRPLSPFGNVERVREMSSATFAGDECS